MNETIYLDTIRPNPDMPYVVECRTHVIVDGEDVMLSVIGFGRGDEGTDKACSKMEKILPAVMGLAYYDAEIIRTG